MRRCMRGEGGDCERTEGMGIDGEAGNMNRKREMSKNDMMEDSGNSMNERRHMDMAPCVNTMDTNKAARMHSDGAGKMPVEGQDMSMGKC
jgi:hypothetical protein